MINTADCNPARGIVSSAGFSLKILHNRTLPIVIISEPMKKKINPNVENNKLLISQKTISPHPKYSLVIFTPFLSLILKYNVNIVN